MLKTLEYYLRIRARNILKASLEMDVLGMLENGVLGIGRRSLQLTTMYISHAYSFCLFYLPSRKPKNAKRARNIYVIVLNLTMKKGILIFIVFFLVGFLVLYILPIEVTQSRELKRGNILIENIENYVNETGKIPESHNWETLRSLGFMEDEMETAYPEIRQINDSTYELIFTIGFDPPYLMWNSQERIWKDDFPTIPDEWKNKN